MAFDRWTHQHHLTPRGWLSGTSTYFGHVQGTAVERPADAIETWEEEVEQPSGWSRENHSVGCIWFDTAFSEDERDAVRKSFASPFRR